MASRQDMQDIMGLPAGTTPRKHAPKKKPAMPTKRMSGISREVVALMGERPPPVAIYDEKKAYKARRHTGPAKKWAQTPFYNPARRDDLILRHWRRKAFMRLIPDDPDVVMEDMEVIEGPVQVQRDYEFSKYNVQVDVPEYTSEQYEEHLKSEDWSREETDYLFTLVKDYSYRWPAIWDRYDFQASEFPRDTADPNTAVALPRNARTMEELKSRFYTVQAVLMTLKTPKKEMTAAEFSLHETLENYTKLQKTETDRKALAAALLTRSREEVIEEEFLLVELQRICASAERLEAERDDIRATHEVPAAASSSQQFQSSQALNALFQQLFAADRSKKRQSTGGAGGARLSLNTSDLMGPNGINGSHGHRDSLASAGTAGGSAVTRKGGSSAQAPVRSLPPAVERKFGVTSHDRLQSGVAFRSDKFFKLRQAKSQAQTGKLQAALIELQVPEIILMTTQNTLNTFEKTIQKVGKLLEQRKAREKEDGELRTHAAMLRRKRQELAEVTGVPLEESQSKEDEAQNEQDQKNAAEAEDEEDDQQDNGNTTIQDADGDADDAEDTTMNDADGDGEDVDGDVDGDVDDSAVDPDADVSEIPDMDAMESEPEDAENDVASSAALDDNDDEDADPTVELNGDEDEDDDDEPDAEVDGEDENEDEEDDADADGDTETNANTRQGSVAGSTDAPPSTSTRQGHKRSASVLSNMSHSSKRTRK